MDSDKRRQHVKQAFANIGEDSIYPDENQIPQESFGSFSYTPEANNPPSADLDAVDELRIPKGTPSLFEVTQGIEEVPDEREVHPSPLNPGELSHLEQGPGIEGESSVENVSLEDKFAQAINRPEAPLAAEQASVEASRFTEEVGTSPEQNEIETVGESVAGEPHVEHLNAPASKDVLEQHDDDDAGLGAMIMKQRAEEKAALGAN